MQIAINVNAGADTLSGTGANSGLSSNDIDYLLEVSTTTVTNETCDTTYTSFTDASVNETALAANYSYTALPNTCYKFRYTVKDIAGNTTIYTSTNATLVTAIDSTLPESKILYPQHNASLKKADYIVGKSTDNVSVASTRISIYDTNTHKFYTGTGFVADTETWLMTSGGSVSKQTRWYYEAPTWSEGHNYTIRSRAMDTANNEEHTDAISFTYDTVNGQEGSIYITNPAVANNADYKIYYPNTVAIPTNGYMEVIFNENFRFSPWITD